MTDIRLMTKSDIPEVLSIWKEHTLSMGTHSIETFLEVDPGGFYVAVENGMVVGSCAAVIQNDDLASVGLYCVRPTHQGRGVGVKTWKKAMDHVGERNCFLNAVEEHFHIYKDKAGFTAIDEHRTIVWYKDTVSTQQLLDNINGVTIEPINEGTVERVIKYDEQVAGFNRSRIIIGTMREKGRVSLVATKDGFVCGYGCLRDDILGSKLLEPLYADNLQIAELILHRLLRSMPSSETCGLTCMGIDTNPSCTELAKKLGLVKMFAMPRMYTKAVLDVRFDKVYSQFNVDFCNI